MSTANLPAWWDNFTSLWRSAETKAQDIWAAAIKAPEKVDQKRLQEAMRLLGKTPADLQTAIADVGQRAAWLAEVDKIPALQRRADGFLSKQVALRRELEEHAAKIEAEIVEARQQEHAAIGELQAARRAEVKLREGRPFPQLAELRAKAAGAQPEMGTLRSAIGIAEQALREIHKAMKKPAAVDTGDAAGFEVVGFQPCVPTRENLERMADHFSTSKRANENRLALLEKETADAQAEIARLESLQLEV